jgi:HD superfamily phosphohydrolase
VRLAAIMHDSGHMFFSHVSEKFFLYNERFPRNHEIRSALNYFNEKISDRVSLHEMLSVMIVNSEHFMQFMQIVYFEKYTSEDDQRMMLDYISGLIVGIAIDKKMLPYSKVIRGAIDADRMDYLSRDSYITKVPLAVDMARLISKITVIKTQNFTPSSIWIDDANGPFYEIAIQNSAQRLVWQLSLARAILYQNIYFHHKKLTAEAILDKALEQIFSILPKENLSFTFLLSLTDEVFSEHFSSILKIDDKNNENAHIEATKLIHYLRDRSFLKRVAGFSRENIKSPSISSYELFKANVIENPFSMEFADFVEKLSEEYINVLTYLDKEIPKTKPQFMFIQAGWNPEAEAGLYIEISDEHYLMSTDIFKETPIIGEENKQKQYYLLTDRIDRDNVYLALENYLFKTIELLFTSATYSCTKFDSNYLCKKRSTLCEKGYYDNSFLLLPDNTLLNMIDLELFNSILSKYRSFDGAGDNSITKDSLILFLRQFLRLKSSYLEMVLLLDGILRLLSNAIFINRQYFTRSMTSIMDEISSKGYDSCCVVKLGGLFDSSNRLFWFFNEIKLDDKYHFVDNVEVAIMSLKNEKCCICLFDDGAYSGSQVISIFQELMGVNEGRTTDEHHVDELSQNAKNAICQAKIFLSYVCFNSNNLDLIIEKLNEIGIRNIEVVYRHDLNTKMFDDSISFFKSAEQKKLVKNKLEKIGFELIHSLKNDHWDLERMKKAALGYNDAQQMVVFDVNVPTYTMTPFWANGTFEGRKWRGLFQRTDNTKKLKA